MKFIKIFFTIIASAVVATSCYNDFDQPAAPTIVNDEVMQSMGMNHITIAELKELFGDINNTGTNDDWASTVYKRFVDDESEGTQAEIDAKRLIVGKNYYIKGKVISNDEEGNIYKSLHIFDDTAAIELKLTNGLYLDYHCDLDAKTSQWVYVRLTGLYLGNFRMMLSLGDIPTFSINAFGMEKYYANSNIVSPNKVALHVFRGERCELTEGTNKSDDIYVVDENNYQSIQNKDFLGRLIRFKGLKVMYKGVKNQAGETPAPLKNGSYDQIYPSWICTSGLTVDGAMTYVVNRPWYKLAYSMNNISLYGSTCVGYDETAQNTSDAGIYTVRTSGYSRFAGKPVPADGTVGDVLAIYTIYADRSSFKGGANDYATYQLSISRFRDFMPDYYNNLTEKQLEELEQWIADNTPEDSITLPQQINDDDSNLD